MLHSFSSSHARQTNLGPIRPKVSDLETVESIGLPQGLPLVFLKQLLQRFHPERLEAGVIVEGQLPQLPVQFGGSLSNTPFVSPVLALLGTFARLRLSACDAPCTASARLDLRFAKGHDSVDPFK